MNRRSFCGLLTVIPTALLAADTLTLPRTELYKLAPLTKAIRQAPKLIIYEGLPHPYNERDAFQREIGSKTALDLDGHRFYERPLSVTPEDIEALRGICSSIESYSTYSPKFCGSFHADYGLEFQDGKTRWQLLICFTCREMKFYGPGTRLIADIKADAYKLFDMLLRKYSNQRPKR